MIITFLNLLLFSPAGESVWPCWLAGSCQTLLLPPLLHHLPLLVKHLHYGEMRFLGPQAFLSTDFQCRDDVSELKWTFWD